MTRDHKDRFGVTPGQGNQNGGSEPTAIREILLTPRTFTVNTAGGADYNDFVIALGDISNNYEINSAVTIDLQSDVTLPDAAIFPMFYGSGTLTIQGNGNELSYSVDGSEGLTIKNSTSVILTFEDIVLVPGVATSPSLYVEGKNITFRQISFGSYLLIVDYSNQIELDSCSGTNAITVRRSTIYCRVCTLHNSTFEYCTLEFLAVTFTGSHIIRASNIIYNSTRINYNYFINDNIFISNSTIQFTGWFTTLNFPNAALNKRVLRLIACSITQLPFNLDFQGSGITFDTAPLEFINCTTPDTLTAVNYNLSSLTFNNCGVIKLINTSLIPSINITGSYVERDEFSIYDNSDFDNTGTDLVATTKEAAIKELWGRIQTP